MVKTAYKKLALQTHPDKNPNDPEARAKFQRVSEAYKRITDPSSFEEDEEMGFDDVNEMFTAMFADMMGGRGGSAGGMPFEMFEMMMVDMMMEEMGMGGMPGFGMQFEEPDSDDEEPSDIRTMEAFLAMQEGRSGMGAYGANGREFDSDEDYDDDDDDDEAMLEFMNMAGMGMSMEDIMMMQLMGGMSDETGFDIDDLAHVLGGGAGRGGRRGMGGRAPPRPLATASNRGNKNRNHPSAKEAKLHSRMYKTDSTYDDNWISDDDSDMKASKTTTGPRVKKTTKKNKKKKKSSSAKKSPVATASPGESVGAPPGSVNPVPPEPIVTSTNPLTSTDHLTSYPRGMVPPTAGSYDDDIDIDDEDITAEEMSELMAAMVGGLGLGGGNGSGSVGAKKAPPTGQSRGKGCSANIPDHRKTKGGLNGAKRGGTINHDASGMSRSSSTPPETGPTAAATATGSAGDVRRGDVDDECYFALGDKVLVQGRWVQRSLATTLHVL